MNIKMISSLYTALADGQIGVGFLVADFINSEI